MTEIESDETEAITCEACGADCPGTSECMQCSRTLCGDCESEYEDCCPACYDTIHDDE